jgi:hypothetical protein
MGDSFWGPHSFPAAMVIFASLTMISYLNAYFYFIGDDLSDPGR